MKNKSRCVWAAVIITLNVFLLAACSNDSEDRISTGDAQLDKAINFLKRTSSENYIRKYDKIFLSLDGIQYTPSDWINFAFSTLGTRDWVDEGSEEASYKVPGMKLIPQGVAMFPGKADQTLEQRPDYEKRKLSGASQTVQLMVIADDAANTLQVKAYRNWQEPPFYETAWAFPQFK